MKYSRVHVIILLIISIVLTKDKLIGQNTVGLLKYDPFKAYDGYNLIYPHNQANVYLLNNCGELVHTWEGDPTTRPGNTAYLIEDGKILATRRPAAIAGNPIWAGGGGATIEIRDWDNNLEWSYTVNDSLRRLHHDISIVPKLDGSYTILAIAWEKKNIEEMVQAGRDTSKYAPEEMWPDYVFEIDPQTDEIIWEWHAWDHLIQDIDPSLDNYGIISEHPELMDINYDFDGSGNPDWMHTNAIDYDPINDQILLSIPSFNEIWILDHSTSTSQAATGSGGLSGLGGDIMYRWGSPSNYGQGDTSDQKLFYQHDANFISDFIAPFDPNYNKIAVFNNRVGADFSTINIINPGFDMYEWSFPQDEGVFGPFDFDLNKTHPIDSTLMHSTGLSSVQYLPNSNLLVCVGRYGYSLEITPDNEIVWEYKTPLRSGAFVAQGDTLTINNNLTFRIFRYPADYSGLEGKDLSPKGWIETEPNTTLCDQILPTSNSLSNIDLTIYPNPTSDMITLQWDNDMYIDIAIYDIQSRMVVQPLRINGGRKYIDTSLLHPGMYVLVINGIESRTFVKE